MCRGYMGMGRVGVEEWSVRGILANYIDHLPSSSEQLLFVPCEESTITTTHLPIYHRKPHFNSALPPATPPRFPTQPLTSTSEPTTTTIKTTDHGRRRPQIPPSKPQLLPPPSPPPQPRDLALHARKHQHDLAQSQRSATARGETRHDGQEEYRSQSATGDADLLRTYLSFFLLLLPPPWSWSLAFA